MFNLKTASLAVRKCAATGWKIKSGKWEPVFHDRHLDALPDEAVVAKIFNRNYPDGVEITAGEIRYAERYL